MKRNLIAIAALGLGLGTNVALADNNWSFDDAYWKQAQGATQSAQATQSAPAKSEFDFVNKYNY
jgi:hypothetical protein